MQQNITNNTTEEKKNELSACPFHNNQHQQQENSPQHHHVQQDSNNGEIKNCPHAASMDNRERESNFVSPNGSLESSVMHASSTSFMEEKQANKCPFHHISQTTTTTSSSVTSMHASSIPQSTNKSLLSKGSLRIPQNFEKTLKSIQERPSPVVRCLPNANAIMDHSNSSQPQADICYFFDAAINGNLEKLKELLEIKQFNINTIDRFGYDCSALQFAANGGKIEIVKYLISKNANVNLIDVSGETALHKACKKGNFEIVKLLLKAGILKDYVNKLGKSPLQITKELGFTGISDYLSTFDYSFYISRKKCNKFFKSNLKNSISNTAFSECKISTQTNGEYSELPSLEKESNISSSSIPSTNIPINIPSRGVCPFHHHLNSSNNNSESGEFESPTKKQKL